MGDQRAQTQLLVPLGGFKGAESATAPSLVARGEPLRVLVGTAQRHSVDMIMIAGPGRTGDPKVWAGSGASRP